MQGNKQRGSEKSPAQEQVAVGREMGRDRRELSSCGVGRAYPHTDSGREKGNDLLVSELLPIAVDCELRINTQRRIDAIANLSAARVYCSQTVVGHGQVEDQAPADLLVLGVASAFAVAAPLACACRSGYFPPEGKTTHVMMLSP